MVRILVIIYLTLVDINPFSNRDKLPPLEGRYFNQMFSAVKSGIQNWEPEQTTPNQTTSVPLSLTK